MKKHHGVLPNLFIVGAAKAGTTSLHHYLSQHPEIFMSPLKETDFFSREDIAEQNLYYPLSPVDSIVKYLELYRKAAGEKVLGESSPSYLYYPEVPRRIFRFNPEGKIVIIIRNPVHRAWSHYLMDKRLGFISWDLDEVIAGGEKDRENRLFYQQYIRLGMYYEQVDRYLKIFPSDSVMIILFDRFIDDTESVLSEICEFLGVNARYAFSSREARNAYIQAENRMIGRTYQLRWIRNTAKFLFPRDVQKWIRSRLFSTGGKPEMPGNTGKMLYDIFRPNLEKLESLLAIDLEKWKRG